MTNTDYMIDATDAAAAAWLFGEAFSAWLDERTPCYPADTLRQACQWEGLPTDGKSDRRFSGLPRSAGYVPAAGEELADRDIWEAMTQAQRDERYWSSRA